MSMSELMSSMDLSTFPQAALVLFAGAFALVVIRLARQPREEINRASHLPIDDLTQVL